MNLLLDLFIDEAGSCLSVGILLEFWGSLLHRFGMIWWCFSQAGSYDLELTWHGRQLSTLHLSIYRRIQSQCFPVPLKVGSLGLRLRLVHQQMVSLWRVLVLMRVPVDMVSILYIPLFTGVSYIPGGDPGISSINSMSNLYQATFLLSFGSQWWTQS